MPVQYKTEHRFPWRRSQASEEVLRSLIHFPELTGCTYVQECTDGCARISICSYRRGDSWVVGCWFSLCWFARWLLASRLLQSKLNQAVVSRGKSLHPRSPWMLQ